MSVEDNKALQRRFYDEVINGGNLDLIDDLIAEDFVDHEVFPGLPNTGPEATKAGLGMFLAAFPDLHFSADEMIAERDKVVTRGTLSGTHKGEFMGVSPTNKSFEVQFMDIVHIHDGKVTEHWGLADQGAMMEQLGIAPEM